MPAVDEIEVVLRRAMPGRVEKGELADETGLTNDELRQGLEQLRKEGFLDEDGDGYAWVAQNGGATAVPEEPPDADTAPQATPQQVEQAATLRVPGGTSYRATYIVTAALSGARGSLEVRDRSARDSARMLEAEIADSIVEGVGVAVSVELTELGAVDMRAVPLDQEEDQGGSDDSGAAVGGGAEDGERGEESSGGGEAQG